MFNAMKLTSPPPVVVDLAGLLRLGITYSNGYLRQLEEAGKFPERRYLSKNWPVWVLAEVEAWLAARVGASRGGGDR